MRIEGISQGLNFESEISGKKNNDLFGQFLKNAIDTANEAQVKADDETKKLITGESQDLHQALISAEEARIQIELVMQIRNKLVESYQEINRMQI